MMKLGVISGMLNSNVSYTLLSLPLVTIVKSTILATTRFCDILYFFDLVCNHPILHFQKRFTFKNMSAFHTHISIDPELRFGKPCIKGTRISVGDILQWLASGMTNAEILEDFPQLQNEHILAALAFAANRESMIKIIAA